MRATTGEMNALPFAGESTGAGAARSGSAAAAAGSGATGCAAGAGGADSGRGLGPGLGGRRRSDGRAGLAADAREHGADVDSLALRDEDLADDPGGGRRDLGVDLVGGDLEQGLVGLDVLAHLLEPPRDRALRDGDAHLGHHDVDCGSRRHVRFS